MFDCIFISDIMDSRFSTANGNILKWPYESTPGDHAYTVESITESSWPAKHMPHLFHINQHISHLETQSGQMLQTHGRHRSSFFTKLYSKEAWRCQNLYTNTFRQH